MRTRGGSVGRIGTRQGALVQMGLALALAALAWGTSGCPGKDDVQRIHAALEVDHAVPFGAVSLGRSRVARLKLKNVGRVPLRLDEAHFESPSPVDFRVSGVRELLLRSGDTAELPLTFAPAALGRRTARLLVPTDSDVEPTVVVELSGEGVLGRAELSTRRIDFGNVGVGTSQADILVLRNDTVHLAEAVVPAPDGDDGDAFSVRPAGDVSVPPGGTARVEVSFSPQRTGPFVARIGVRPCPSCAPEEVELVGEGIESVLVADPTEIDFGFVEPGGMSRRTVRVTNRGSRPAVIRGVQKGQSTGPEFRAALPSGSVTLQQDEWVDIEVTFSPTKLEPRSGTVRIDTNTPSSPVILLKGFGGGPRLEVSPSPLSFPRTGVGLSVEKKLTLRNTGNDPQNQQPLHIVDYYVESGAEFTVRGNLPPFDLVAGDWHTLVVTYAPLADTGDQKTEGVLVVVSNDPANPVTRVPLRGSAKELGPCSYEVVPEKLDFGQLKAGQTARLAFAVRNTGQNTCGVANVRLSPSSPRQFVVDPVSSRLVEPGEQLVVVVAFTPEELKGYAGLVEMDVTSPLRPAAQVPLSGLGAVSCLEVDPPVLAFGTVGLRCLPPTRGVSVKNACQSPVTLESVRIGAGTSAEFVVEGSSGARRTLAPGSQTLVQVTYDPADEGDDYAPLYLDASNSPVPYLVALEATGADRPTRTDTFVQPPRELVDVLIVMDNSGSFADKQERTGKNFDRFIQSATLRDVDFRIAVTTTGLWAYRGGWADCPGGVYGGEAGRFFPLDGARPRILTPQTPNLHATFMQNVKVGVCHWWEEGLAAAQLALSPPLIDRAKSPQFPEPNDGNLGFLREEAKLYVLYVTDADDSGTASPESYVNHLKSLKPGRPDLLSVGAIVTFPSCTTGESVGARYFEVVNAFGGMLADICDSDWGAVLQRIGADAFRPRSIYALSEQPEGRDIEVRIDGKVIARTDAAGRPVWDFDPTIGDFGAVVFEPGHEPGPRTTLEVKYPIPCPKPRP